MRSTAEDHIDTLILDTAERLFSKYQSAYSQMTHPNSDTIDLDTARRLWSDCEELGFPQTLVPESAGGIGLEPSLALRVLRKAAKYAVSSPLGETMLANYILTNCGFGTTNKPVAIIPWSKLYSDHAEYISLEFVAHNIAWARIINDYLLLDQSGDICFIQGLFNVSEKTNISGEPRDTVKFEMQIPKASIKSLNRDIPDVNTLNAFLKTQEIAGALEEILDITIKYAQDRSQFGRPIAKFQAIQHLIAEMATHTAAAIVAADMLAKSFNNSLKNPHKFTIDVAAAKIRTSEAATKCIAMSHQIHGAIGVTAEYSLQNYTRRLLAWRDECGSDSYWSYVLGEYVCRSGPSHYWDTITTSGGNN